MSVAPTLLIDAALHYAAFGWPIFPIVPGGKTPLTSHGFKDATTDPEQIKAWWSATPDANIGLSTGKASDVDVVDLDTSKPDQADDGRKTFDAMEALYGRIYPLTSVTPSGGMHLFFKHLDGMRNSAKRLPGIDVRGDGGYVVLPPSLTPNGAYRWVIEPTSKPTLIEWPAWLATALDKRKPKTSVEPSSRSAPKPSNANGAYGRKALQELHDELATEPKGSREDKRNRVAYRMGRLVAAGHFAADEAVRVLDGACETCGLTAEEGAEKLHRQNEAGVSAGVAAGPPPSSPRPVRVVVTSEGVDERETHADEVASDVGNGRRLVRLFGDDLRHEPSTGWYVWDGERWDKDAVGRVIENAKASARLLRVESESIEDKTERKEARVHALRSEKAERIRAAVAMAQTDPAVVVRFSQLDHDPMLLACSNGTLDLRTGRLKKHDRNDLITKRAHARWDEHAKCPTWDAFVERVLPDQEVRAFVQRAVGYSLTGHINEQCFFLLYGKGANGKSTLLTALRNLLGEHAQHADFSTFLSSGYHGGGPRADLARLAGARLVTSTEPDKGARFSESVLKTITGGDPITADFKYGQPFEYVPQMKLWLGVNDRPKIRGTDHAIWRRVRLIPFTVTIPDSEQDSSLDAKLASESPGILRWAVEGCAAWQSGRLRAPSAVLLAVKEYRPDEDILAEFFEDKCHLIPGGTVLCSDLYVAYRKWAEARGDDPSSSNAFGRDVSERPGISRTRNNNQRLYTGVQLRG